MLGQGPLLDVLAWVLTYGLHSTLLILAALLASRLMKRESSRRREVLWRAALLGGLLTASVQIGFDLDPLGRRLLLAHDPTAAATLALRVEPDPALLLALLERAPRDAAATPTGPPRASGVVDRGLTLPAGSTANPALIDDLPALLSRLFAAVTWSGAAVVLWGLGVALGLALLGLSWTRLHRHLASREPIRRGPLPALLHELCRRAGIPRVPRLSSSPSLRGPITLGVLFPEICLPERALRDLGRAETEAMLAHELAHAVRRDPAWQWGYRTLERVLFFQPLNRLARRHLEEAAELLCDDWAVRHTGRGIDLARCLTRVATWLVGDRRALPTPAMAATPSALGVRVERLLDVERSVAAEARRPAHYAALAGVFALVAALVPGATAARAAAAEPPEAPRVTAEPAPPDRATVAGEAGPGAELAALTGPLAWVVEALDAEIAALEEEIGALRDELAAAGLEQTHAHGLELIEQGVRELRTRREHLRDVLPRLSERTSPTRDRTRTPFRPTENPR